MPLLLACVVPLSSQETGGGFSKGPPLAWNFPGQSPRSLAMELAAGNVGEGYQVHDGFWSCTLSKSVPVLVEVFLFAGNDYRFSVASLEPFSQLSLSIFDATGCPVGMEYSGDSFCSTAGLSVIKTGRYFVRLVMTGSDTADTCMVYCYK
ncbi:MAG: hypothetical protein WCG66_00795 [bacterium]